MQDQPEGLQLRIVQGPNAGTRIKLRAGQNLVGRSVDRDHVRLDSTAVSRRHLAIYVEDDRVFARDLASRNGTLVNGARLSGTRSLDVGDVLEVGDTMLVIEPADDPAAAGALRFADLLDDPDHAAPQPISADTAEYPPSPPELPDRAASTAGMESPSSGPPTVSLAFLAQEKKEPRRGLRKAFSRRPRARRASAEGSDTP